MQYASGQYDDFARVPRTRSRQSRNGIFASQNPRFPSRGTVLCHLKSRCQERIFWMQRPGAKNWPLETADVHRDRKSGDDTGEIPAETASLESPTKCAVWEDWMVVCAVRCEPVSIPNSLLTAKITENFSNLAILSDFSYAKTHALRRLRYRLPTQNNRENNCRIRENFAQKQGCFRSLGGGRASSHRLQSPPQKWGSMFPSYRSVSVGGSFRRCRRAVSTPDRHGNFSAPI
jgi:hypothetical protein